LSYRTPEAVSDYYRRTEVLSFRLGVLLVAFYGETTGKDKIN